MAGSIAASWSKARERSQERTDSKASESYESEISRGSYNSQTPLLELERLLADFNLEQTYRDSALLARTQTRGAVDALFRDYRESSLPQIFSGMTGAGAFNDTSSQLMANDAYGRTVSSAAELELGVANTFTNQALSARQQMLEQFTNLLAHNIQTQEKTSGFGSRTGTETTHGKRTGTNVSVSGGYGTGGTAPNLTGMFGGNSDIRLKENIVVVGEYESLGVPMYEFQYIGKPEVWRGVMAQDLLGTVHEHALSVDAEGMYRVNYGALGISMELATGE